MPVQSISDVVGRVDTAPFHWLTLVLYASYIAGALLFAMAWHYRRKNGAHRKNFRACIIFGIILIAAPLTYSWLMSALMKQLAAPHPPTLESGEEGWDRCEKDTDCVMVEQGCCPDGLTINRDFQESWYKKHPRAKACMTMQVECLQKFSRPYCHDTLCKSDITSKLFE